jgi:hypothetical protein
MPEHRDEAIASLRDALFARTQAKRRRTVGALGAAAAVALGLGGAALLSSHHVPPAETSNLSRVREPAGVVSAVRSGHTETLGAGTRVDEGTELRTASGAEAHLDYDTGTAVTLGSATQVRLVEQSRWKRFALEAGSFSAHVAKLAPGERFVVATPDAEIEVHGTVFSVTIAEPDPACGDQTPTRLAVSEGVVIVRHGADQITVAAGEHWPRCAANVEGAPVHVVARGKTAAPLASFQMPTVNIGDLHSPNMGDSHTVTPASSERAGVDGGSAAPAPTITTPLPSMPSHLAEQNDLYDRAMQAKREGRGDVAVMTLERLLSSYPTGPLAESAAVERMRMLAGANHARARLAARDYLTRYPNGFGRAEAEALAAGAL